MNKARGEFSSETMERMQKEELIVGPDITASDIEQRITELSQEFQNSMSGALEPFIKKLIKIIEDKNK